MKTMFKKMLAVLTAVLMLLCMLPVGVFAESDIPIDEAHFPDANFRAYVSENCDTDGNGALSPEEIAAKTYINVGDMEIADLTGIEYFTALESLYCWHNQLTELDVSNNTALKTLGCHDNQLTELDVSKLAALEELFCDDNQLTELDVSNNTVLHQLWCSNNQLTQLDVNNNTTLFSLDCSGNQLTNLDLSNNTSLGDWDEEYEEGFKCDNNEYQVSSDPFDLTTLPGNFDISKASNWQGGSVSGNILTFNPDETEVTYTYDCGNGYSAEFMLILSDTVPGDYDDDGEVTVQDAIMILRSAMNLISGDAPAAADVDGDGKISVQDAILALRMAMGLV